MPTKERKYKILNFTPESGKDSRVEWKRKDVIQDGNDHSTADVVFNKICEQFFIYLELPKFVYTNGLKNNTEEKMELNAVNNYG